MAFTKIGALWLKDGAKGKYMAGEIERQSGEKIRVMVFKNTFKTEGDTKPDYTINMVLDDPANPPDPVGRVSNPATAGEATGPPSALSPQPSDWKPLPLTDDIPF